MSKKPCEAMPIESPSSIQSESPSARVRMKRETASSSRTIAPTPTALEVSDSILGSGRTLEATEAIGKL